MPTTENATLQRIQKEISEVIEREKELRSLQNGNTTNLNNKSDESDHENQVEKVDTPPETRPILQHSKSLGAYSFSNNSNGINNSNNNTALRKFTQNPAAKGVMHKFIKSRGKLTAASLMGSQSASSSPSNSSAPILNPNSQAQIWNIPDSFEPPKILDPSQCIRKGFIPFEEKLKKELEDLHMREMELRSERRKSQPDFSSLVEIEPPPLLAEVGMKKARSMAQLYNPEEYNSLSPGASNLKAARSLAALCDTNEEELDAPGSHFLINQFEEMIQKNQGVRC
ncbi:uncharacterized protein [Onthophagus taurus]|uniref:uncharacterized protein n=1 Tax=Onthophagus taurus TaxID=166361 RepID=UPI000C20A9BC|nr:uncharacterized protein LOC111424159 [Onthophagus taurus]